MQTTGHAPTADMADAIMQHSSSMVHVIDGHLDVRFHVVGVQTILTWKGKERKSIYIAPF